MVYYCIGRVYRESVYFYPTEKLGVTIARGSTAVYGHVNVVICKAWESPPACCQDIFLISQEIFKEKQDIKNEARQISKINIKVTNITIRA